MTDYGHDLRFGSFLTPHNHDPHHVVNLAVFSERVGLDLVTFQDHPYQPAFLDTWTLISWTAARTEAHTGPERHSAERGHRRHPRHLDGRRTRRRARRRQPLHSQGHQTRPGTRP